MAETIRDIERSVATMCQMTEADVRPEMPVLFSQLVRQLRTLDDRALTQLYRRATSAQAQPCVKAKYVMSTAVLMPIIRGKHYVFVLARCLFLCP